MSQEHQLVLYHQPEWWHLLQKKLNEELPVLEVLAIYISRAKSEPMLAVPMIEAIAGFGLVGDRYASRTGLYSGKRLPDADRQVSLISRQAFDDANALLLAENKEPFTEAETRRNLIVNARNDQLNALLGKKFKVGEVVLEGSDLCTPCTHPSNLTKKSDFLKAFENRGGLRARVLTPGWLKLKAQDIL